MVALRAMGRLAARRAKLWGALAFACGFPASAAPPPRAAPASPVVVEETDAGKLQARVLFDRARELYAAGRYREAAEQLEHALKFDPQGKDLVYNLALVRERLGEPDEATVFVDRYLAMKLDPAERQRAEAFRRRLEGARDEISEKRRKVVVVPVEVERERIFDAWVWGPLAGAGVAALSGAIFGSLAVSTRPSGFVTGRDGTYDDLVARSNDAHAYAMGADASWILAALGVAGSAIVYFTRDSVPVATHAAESSR